MLVLCCKVAVDTATGRFGQSRYFPRFLKSTVSPVAS